MKHILTVVLALLASSVLAADYPTVSGPEIQPDGKTVLPLEGWEQIKPGTYKRGKHIIVTDNIPAEKLPAFIKEMTAKEFKSWAEKHNEQQYARAAQRHEDYVLNRGPLLTMNLASSSASHTTRFGGGYGAGGVGGAGGYLGYGNNSGTNFGGVSYGGYGGFGGYGGGGYGGFGNGASFNGNTIRTTDTSDSQSWVKTFPDLNDGGGGPVMLINPYCFDYWRQHTE